MPRTVTYWCTVRAHKVNTLLAIRESVVYRYNVVRLVGKHAKQRAREEARERAETQHPGIAVYRVEAVVATKRQRAVNTLFLRGVVPEGVA